MVRKHLLLLISVFSTLTGFSQEITSCGFISVQHRKLLHNKNYKSGLTDNESRLNNYLKSGGTLRTAATVYTLPVVFHVITNGGVIGAADNPSDANILATLKLLNGTWSKNGISYGGADLQIQFALAQRSLTCGSTNGINRVNGSDVQWNPKEMFFPIWRSITNSFCKLQSPQK